MKEWRPEADPVIAHRQNPIGNWQCGRSWKHFMGCARRRRGGPTVDSISVPSVVTRGLVTSCSRAHAGTATDGQRLIGPADNGDAGPDRGPHRGGFGLDVPMRLVVLGMCKPAFVRSAMNLTIVRSKSSSDGSRTHGGGDTDAWRMTPFHSCFSGTGPSRHEGQRSAE